MSRFISQLYIDGDRRSNREVFVYGTVVSENGHSRRGTLTPQPLLPRGEGSKIWRTTTDDSSPFLQEGGKGVGLDWESSLQPKTFSTQPPA